MKFFTPEWHSGELPDEDAEQVPRRYQEHIASIADALPPSVQLLATKLSLHDALIERVKVNAPAEAVEFLLRCGDLQVGYFNLRLSYQGVRVDLPTLASIATDPEIAVLYDEVDITSIGFLHRILFWPYREFSIEFRGLQIERTPATGRDVLSSPSDRFHQVGHGADRWTR